MPYYIPVSGYIDGTRSLLQDLIEPYRYADQDVYNALNLILGEVARLRPDLFLDLKYQTKLQRGDINDGAPLPYNDPDDANTLVPIPGTYLNPILWGMAGWLQLYDVTDTQDQRAQAFLQKFSQHFLTLSAA